MISITSTLDAVTVFREGAVCLRLVQFDLQHGRALRVSGLPLSMDPGSLRARVISGEGRVLDVRPHFDVQLAEEIDVPAEQRALESACMVIDRLESRRERIAAEISELEGLRPRFLEPRRGDAPREAPVAAMLALGDFTDTELTRRLEARRALDAELEDAQRERQLRDHRLQEASTARRTERARLARVAVVMLEHASTGRLGLEYLVPGARWVPNYQLRLDRGLGSGTLSLRASIAQNSGEDWADVQLALSTASLSRRTDLPELKALKIGRRQGQPPRSGWREPPPGLEELFAGYDSIRRVQSPQAGRGGDLGPRGAAMDALRKDADVSKRAPEKKKSERRAPGSGGAPPAPAAAPMSPAASLRSSAPMKTMGEPVLRRERSVVAHREQDEAAADEGGLAEEAPLMGDSLSTLAPQEPPEEVQASIGLEVAMMDYSRLFMAGVEHPGTRGRLQPMGTWDSLLMVGVSLQLDLVIAAVNAAHLQAESVGGLAVPEGCASVGSIDSFDYRYDCRARADVPSTGKWVNVAVTTCEVGLSAEYVCVPAVETKVYRTLQVTNRSPHALLPGPVDVTAGDEFLMTSRLPAIPPRAEIAHRLGLGVEEAIKVARKTNFKESTGGFLGGSTVLPHDVEIELNNRLSTPALIEVRERVPWVDPEDEKDVKVEEPLTQPPWEKFDAPIDGTTVVRGARRWRVTVPPSQSVKLAAQFTIRIPSDRMIVGGNRRS